MTSEVDVSQEKYAITFKPKDKRPNKRDDKLELFRSIMGLTETRDLLDLNHFTGHHATTPIRKTTATITDINSYKLPFIMARLTDEQANRLRKDPNIQAVEKTGYAHVNAQVMDWWIPQVKANTVWATPFSTRGLGVNVASIDTGADYNHLDLAANIKVNQSFLDTDTSSIAKDAPHYHGTHVIGIIGAADNSEGVVGGAPSCNLWNLRAGDAAGSFAVNTDCVEAHVFASNNGADIINNSWGLHSPSGDPYSALRSATEDAFLKGIVVNCAAGNESLYNNTYLPARWEWNNAVSSLQQDNIASSFTNFGPYVDYAFYGTDINSTMNNNAYQLLSGTSMACPGLSSLCALALAAYRDNGCPPYSLTRTRAQVINTALQMSCSKLGKFTESKSEVYGWGVPQADKLVGLMKGVIV